MNLFLKILKSKKK